MDIISYTNLTGCSAYCSVYFQLSISDSLYIRFVCISWTLFPAEDLKAWPL